ncbi:unnamed protein product [Cuscuta europaea]|uniref:Phytocyanin domain-containing protein n=1 Tax=Cuscuta europaea TaxID=41803 RepID=A0A9P1E1P2_CUSEU|nr:unnamed protein product [Cuscuta europaea]
MAPPCPSPIAVVLAVFVLGQLSGFADAYKNYTVGGYLGWTDNGSVDYQKWASNNTFSLGDFLIFRTDTNHSVIQTYNETTYEECDSEDDDTALQWSYTDPSTATSVPPSTPLYVPLTKVGTTYFFSDDYDGEQCKNGLRMKLNVTHGQGLPPSMRSPDKSPAPTSPQSGDDSVPDTLVPAYFNNPHNVSDEDSESPPSSVSSPTFSKVFGTWSTGILFVLVLACTI